MHQDGRFETLAGPAARDWLLWEDGPLLAFNKPAGLLTEGVLEGHATMVASVKDWLREKYHKPGNVYLGIPHRLDRATSGVLVFTRNSKTAARVAEQFEKRQVTKKYWALLEERPRPEAGLLVDWLRKFPEEGRSEVVERGTDGAREARLEYRILGDVEPCCLVEITLLTGRMHQIRVQFASRGWPVVGDTKYGGSPWLTDQSDDSTKDGVRIALHARSLTLLHPIRYDEVSAEAPLPDYWGINDGDFNGPDSELNSEGPA